MNKPKYYSVFTSIPYVNGEPHIGHALEFVQADVLARYARQQGYEVLFGTGTDEHGTKVAEAAKKAGQTPQAYTDKMSENFKDLIKLLNISNNRFIRTTDKGHEQRAAIIWKKLEADIYKASYTGLYDKTQEEFVTETQADPARLKPDHPQAYERLQEENYFFRLSKYNDQIKELIKTNKLRILPEGKRSEILSLLEKEGLEDISISRPTKSLEWGVPVPDDKTQVMYVWFEALMNYITVLGYPENEDFAHYWPANVQVVGKDILRFHAAIWPAMLLGLGIGTPQTLYVHGHIVLGGGIKMSKSLGNGISPKEVVDVYGVDAYRYYFLRHISSQSDGEFSWERFEAAYNNELGNELGNAVQRVATMITRYQNGLIGDMPSSAHDTSQFQQALNECKFDKALEEVWERVRGVNQYIEEEKPWQLAKAKDDDHLREVLAYAAGALLGIATLLEPFLPDTSAKITKIFKEGYIQQPEGVLFPKIEQHPAEVQEPKKAKS